MTQFISSPQEAQVHLKALARKKVEEIWTLALGPNLELLGASATFRGTRDRCLFHPREIFHFAIKKRATCFLLAHNHPSGPTLPSREDWTITRRMIFLGLMLQIPMVDHLIVSPEGLYSFRSSQKALFERLEALEDRTDRELRDLAYAPLIGPPIPWSRGKAGAEPSKLPQLEGSHRV